MNSVENPFLKPNKTVAVIGYALIQLFLGSFVILGIAFILNKIQGHNLLFQELLELFSDNSPELIQEFESLYVVSKAVGNFLMYLCSFCVVVFFMRNFIRDDGKRLLSGFKRFVWLIPLCAVIGFGISYGVEYGLEKIIDSTENQASIELLIGKGGAVWMFFAVVLFAPVVEELVYRKAIFEYLKKFPIALSYVISIILFTLPHLLTTMLLPESPPPLDILLMSIPYALSGFLLCLTYHLCGKNIYASWFFHFANNFIAFILIFL